MKSLSQTTRHVVQKKGKNFSAGKHRRHRDSPKENFRRVSVVSVKFGGSIFSWLVPARAIAQQKSEKILKV